MADWWTEVIEWLRQWLPAAGGAGAAGYGLAKGARQLFDQDTDAADPCQLKVIRGKSGFLLNDRIGVHVDTDGNITVRAINVDSDDRNAG